MELIVENGEIKKAYGYDEAVLTLPDGIKRLCEGIFTSFIFLEHIHLPNSLEIIDEHVFNNCVVLEDMYIPDGVHTIGEYAFQYCLKMQTLHLPKELKRIENCTFRHCSSLKEVTVPEKVEYIDYDAFFGCEALEKFVSLNPECTYGRHVFYNCKNLKHLDAPLALSKLDDVQLSRVCLEYCRFPESFCEASKKAYENILKTPGEGFMTLVCENDDDRALGTLLNSVLDSSYTDLFLDKARQMHASRCIGALLEYKNRCGVGGIDGMMSEFEI